MSFNTPLRYPGGKGRLTQFVADIIAMNGLTGGHYVEPYAGGAGIAVSLLYLQYVSRIHLNDLNNAVYAFWHIVLNETEELCRLINDTPVTMDEWRRQRLIQDDKDASLIELGFSTFFLNRTNRSGIIQGGVIGGKDQAGKWKIDARFNKSDMVKRIQKIASFKARIEIHNLDAADLIVNVLPRIPEQALVYLDPPYYVKGRGLYQNHYYHDDHKKIAKLVASEVKQKWIVSYDNVEQIKEMYAGFRQETFSLHYSAGARYRGSEVFVYGPGLKTPAEIRPFRGAAA